MEERELTNISKDPFIDTSHLIQNLSSKAFLKKPKKYGQMILTQVYRFIVHTTIICLEDMDV